SRATPYPLNRGALTVSTGRSECLGLRVILLVERSVRLFLFDDPPPPNFYTLSLHDALPISTPRAAVDVSIAYPNHVGSRRIGVRSEEHTSELQSRFDLVCRLLLEKKNPCRCATSRGARRPARPPTSAADRRRESRRRRCSGS